MTDLAQITVAERPGKLRSSIRCLDGKIAAAASRKPMVLALTAPNGISRATAARKSQTGDAEASFRAAALAAVPRLRVFALSLSRRPDRADDLVQETLLRAFLNWRRFEPGSNLQAWLVTILRNAFYSEERSRRREVEDGEGAYAETLVVPAEQAIRPECDEFNEALHGLPEEMREAVLLIGAYGFSYREVASLCDCAIGTIKSRVNRARSYLAATLALEPAGHFVQDAICQSVAARAEESRSHGG
jgi:RNA polymerase sigma-70 factor, ECF subfamily